MTDLTGLLVSAFVLLLAMLSFIIPEPLATVLAATAVCLGSVNLIYIFWGR